MPCTYESPEEVLARQATEIAKDRKKLKMVEAILCGVLSTLSDTTQFGAGNDEWFDTFLDRLDYKEMGVTRNQVESWWAIHLEEDRRRRERERQEAEEASRKFREKAEKDRLIETAKQKLSADEKKALGIE